MKTLIGLNVARLQVLEAGQHVKSILKGIDELGIGFITDTTLQNYLAKLKDASTEYDKALLKVMKSDETAKIVEADAVRDKAITAMQRIIGVYELSEDTAEVEAFQSLHTLFNTYKGIQKWNFEEESNGIDNLLIDLHTAKYQAHIDLLNLNAYVERMQVANEKFKTLFAGRTQEKANTEYFDTKALRDDMTLQYNNLAEYVLVMAKAFDTEQYNKPLDILNTVRKYYADLLAKRKGTHKGEAAEPIPPME